MRSSLLIFLSSLLFCCPRRRRPRPPTATWSSLRSRPTRRCPSRPPSSSWSTTSRVQCALARRLAADRRGGRRPRRRAAGHEPRPRPADRAAAAFGAGAYALRAGAAPRAAAGWAALNNAGDTVVLERADGAVLDRVAYPRDAFAVDGPQPPDRPGVPDAERQRRLVAVDDASGAANAVRACAPSRPGRVRFTAGEVAAGERAGSATAHRRAAPAGPTGAWSCRGRRSTAARSPGSRLRRGIWQPDARAQRRRARRSRVPRAGRRPRTRRDESFTVVLGGGSTAASRPGRSCRITDNDARRAAGADADARSGCMPRRSRAAAAAGTAAAPSRPPGTSPASRTLAPSGAGPRPAAGRRGARSACGVARLAAHPAPRAAPGRGALRGRLHDGGRRRRRRARPSKAASSALKTGATPAGGYAAWSVVAQLRAALGIAA